MANDERRGQFAVAVAELRRRNVIGEAWEVWPGCWATAPVRGWQHVGREAAGLLPGQIWPGRGGVSWVCGSGGPHGRIMASTQVQDIGRAQDTCAGLGIRSDTHWSIGRMARDLLTYVCDPDTCPIRSEHLGQGIELGYHCCKPGAYPDSLLLDVSAYYYSLLCRAPSLRVVCGRRGSVVWGPMSDGERGRFRDVLALVAPDKILRNSLVGCAMGATGKRLVYMRDKQTREVVKRRMTLPGGPFRGLGLLILRSGYEITAAEALCSDATYSTIDSVVTQSTLSGRVWERFGLEVSVKASGDADIIRRGCWAVGPLKTEPYTSGYRGTVAVPPAPLPAVQYHRAWL